MASLTVECLRCGAERVLFAASHERLDGGECPRCDYVGWVPSNDMSEALRRRIRERPPEHRRLHAA